ncbi:MAG: dockerin type I domain-containing protein [Chloroflexota bacterium]|nr:dockerin type I domain-containing protein [Chloroflexota bacterium]
MTTGETVTLALWVDQAENLHRVELHVDYDWSGLEVQDAQPDRAGVQIEPGPIFCCTACIAQNEVAGGRIRFVAQRDYTNGPFSGSGIVAYVTFLATATEWDTYTVSFDQATIRILDDKGGHIAVAQFTDAAIIIPPPVTLTGLLTREGWSSYERSTVNTVLYPAAPPYEPISWGRACTDERGDFALEIAPRLQPPPADILPPGDPPTSAACTSRWAFARLDFTNYLSECYWKCADDDTLHIGWHDLEGGDVNEDGCINILDVVQIIGEFGEMVESPCYVPSAECPLDPPPANVAPACDLNGDCRVNILDLTQAAGNFDLCSNCQS